MIGVLVRSKKRFKTTKGKNLCAKPFCNISQYLRYVKIKMTLTMGGFGCIIVFFYKCGDYQSMNNFSSYANLGLSVFPLRGKHPLVSWKRYQTAHADEASVQAWDNTPHNIGIATGHVSEILVVDVDGDYPADWPEMPETWKVKTKKGYHYYFHMPIDAHYRNSTRIAENVDIRANGGYVVAPPSKHPDGGLYEWETSPSDCLLASLPQWLVEVLEKHDKRLYEGDDAQEVARPVKIESREDGEQAYIDAAVKSECEALRGIGEGGRNDQLNKSAFALAGLLSAGDVEAILTPIAKEIGLGNVEIRKTIASGCESAKPRKIPARAAKLEVPEEDCMIVKKALERNGKTVSHSEISPHLISGASGMVGDMVKFTVETSLYPQPVLALAAAIPFIGYIMSHRVATETDLRSNFFTMGIAESGAGKDHARRCVSKVMEATGLSDGLSGDPASATAVIASVKRAEGASLMQIDEMGRYLKSLSGSNAASHNRMVTTNMMHMYNSASNMFIGQEYANNDLNGGRSDIDQPCLNIYGTTVPHNFYGSLTSEEAYDGFLSRWLIFETTRFDIEPTMDRAPMDVPDHLINAINGWRQQPKYSGGGEGQFAHHTMIKPRVIPFSEDARRSFYALIKDCRVRMSQADHPIDKAFWNRCAEHSAKLALVGHEGDNIDSAVLDWAIELSKALTISTIANIKANVADNAYEAELQNILKIVTNSKGGISKSDLTRKTQRIERRKRQDIVDTLIESGDIREEKSESAKNGKITTMYRV